MEAGPEAMFGWLMRWSVHDWELWATLRSVVELLWMFVGLGAAPYASWLGRRHRREAAAATTGESP